tara:strand:- start:1213 stop:2358 length:1146 start_codon:yes stop_codon:yes gene_type:complete
MKTYKSFYSELKKLKGLYNSGVDSFLIRRENLAKNIVERTADFENEIYLNNISEENFFIAESPIDYKWRLKDYLAKQLRTVIFIRIISALEVFLIDSIRETFVARKDLFHKQNSKIEFTHSELLSSKSISSLWSKLINRECRNLQNQGFKEVRKYYKTNFNIDFANSQISLMQIEKLHDIRHLMVHKLGRTDEQFRKKYDYKQDRLSLKQEEFYNGLEMILKFGVFINEEMDKIISVRKPKQKKIETKGEVILQITNSNNMDFIYPDFTFQSGEQILLAQDIIDNYEINESIITLTISGERKYIRSYISQLTTLEKKQDILIIEKTIVEPAKLPKISKEKLDEAIVLIKKGKDKEVISIETDIPVGQVKKIIYWYLENKNN